MLRFLYRLFFPAKPKQQDIEQNSIENTEELLSETDRQELMSCKAEIVTSSEFGFPKTIFQKESEILDLIRKFEDKTLPIQEWTHTAHLIVAAYYLKSYNWEEAQTKLRASIIAYNETVGIINSPTNGYHETITIFWLRFVKNMLEKTSWDFLYVCKTLPYIQKNRILYFYTSELIQSTEARQIWVEPDKKRLRF